MSWQLVQMEEDVGMSECETHEEPPSPAKVTRDRKTSCLCVCAHVCGLVCVCIWTNSWEKALEQALD